MSKQYEYMVVDIKGYERGTRYVLDLNFANRQQVSQVIPEAWDGPMPVHYRMQPWHDAECWGTLAVIKDGKEVDKFLLSLKHGAWEDSYVALRKGLREVREPAAS